MIDRVNKEIGDAVKVALKRKGVTQAQLARSLGMEPSNLSNMLAGKGSKVPKRWREVLEFAGLDLTVRPAQAPEGAEGEA